MYDFDVILIKLCIFYMYDIQENYFNFKDYFNELKTRELGAAIVYSHEMASTQTLLKENCSGIYEGMACVADLQSEGKGKPNQIFILQTK